MRPPKEIRDLFEESKVSVSSEKNSKILDAALLAYERTQNQQSTLSESTIWRIAFGSKAGCLAVLFLLIGSWLACFVLSMKVIGLRDELAQRDAATIDTGDSATINLYLREHQDVVARHASLSPSSPQPLQLRVNQHDILYYEIFDDQPEGMYPGIIVRGPLSQREISSPENPAISNGHTLKLSKARETFEFTLVSPSWLDPGYRLDQIRRIEGRDALHLLYTDGIETLSLFEQPLDGQRGLEAKDFREYALYRNKGQVGGTILAWRDNALSYVLIGNDDMTQLMKVAQSINAGNERRQK
ncbi:MAG: hypothetical protein ACYS74_02415 [Planctomycetota bacterium]|jgi:hypothetical protein